MYVAHELFYKDEDVINVNGYSEVSVIGLPFQTKFDNSPKNTTSIRNITLPATTWVDAL